MTPEDNDNYGEIASNIDDLETGANLAGFDPVEALISGLTPKISPEDIYNTVMDARLRKEAVVWTKIHYALCEKATCFPCVWKKYLKRYRGVNGWKKCDLGTRTTGFYWGIEDAKTEVDDCIRAHVNEIKEYINFCGQ